MNWTEIWKIALTCLASAGGIGGVILAIVKFSSNIIADQLSKKYDLKMQKALEGYKTDLSKKEFISKTRFEAEFRIYQELSEKNTSLVYCADESLKIIHGGSFPEEEVDEYSERFSCQLKDTKQINRRYAPFIDEQIYAQFLALEKIASEMYSLFKIWQRYYLIEQSNNNSPNHVYESMGCVQEKLPDLQKSLFAVFNKLLCELRTYLKTLDVLE